MLQQPSHKAMMHGFGGGMELESPGKFLILYKISCQQLVQPWIFHAADKAQKLLIHLCNVLFGNRQVIRLHILPFSRLADPAYIQLVSVLKQCHIRLHMNIIHSLKLPDSR